MQSLVRLCVHSAARRSLRRADLAFSMSTQSLCRNTLDRAQFATLFAIDDTARRWAARAVDNAVPMQKKSAYLRAAECRVRERQAAAAAAAAEAAAAEEAARAAKTAASLVNRPLGRRVRQVDARNAPIIGVDLQCQPISHSELIARSDSGAIAGTWIQRPRRRLLKTTRKRTKIASRSPIVAQRPTYPRTLSDEDRATMMSLDSGRLRGARTKQSWRHMSAIS